MQLTLLMLQGFVNVTLPYTLGREMVLLANCFYEANNPKLYEPLDEIITIVNVPLTPPDCLSLGCRIAKCNIAVVRIVECNLSSSCMKAFTQGLGSYSSNVECLYLSSNSIGEASVAILSEWILSSNMETFVLYLCDIGCKGLTFILNSLKKRFIQELRLLASYVHVDESNGLLLQDFIIATPSLKSLHLSYNEEVGNIGAHYIAQALRHNTTLKTLDLSRCGITLPGAITLCDSLETNTGVNDLNLSQNDIGDDGIVYLSHSLQLNKTLTALNVMSCWFAEIGLESLAVMLTFNTTIRKIEWADVYMDSKKLKGTLASAGLITPSVESVLF